MLIEELKNSKDWDTFLEASPDGTFYHSLKWKEIIQQSFSNSPLYLTVKDTSGRLVGICPGFITSIFGLRTYNSIPYSDFGGPVITRRYAKEASASLKDYLRRPDHRENMALARLRLADPALQIFFRSTFGYHDRCLGIVRIDLKQTPPSFIWKKTFSGNRRRKISLVERSGYQARVAKTTADLQVFHALYWDNMKGIGANPYPYRFMKRLWDALYPENLHIWLADRNKDAAGVLFFKYKKESYAAFAGVDRTKHVHGLINYLWWKEIEKAENEGRRYVSLGSTPSDPTHPYHVQKMSFGGSFQKQETVWLPFAFAGCVISQMVSRGTTTWRKVRDFLPVCVLRNLKKQVERIRI